MGERYPYLFLLVAALCLEGCWKTPAEKKDVIRPVKVFHISGPEDIAQRSFPGMVEASEKVDLSFQIPGRLIELSVKEGDQVTQGQFIAKIDPSDYEIAVAEAKSKAELAQVELERTGKLLAKQFASQSQYDAQKTAVDVAQANLKLAEQNLNYTNLFAPFVGEISKKYVENFQNIQAKQLIVRLQDRKILDIKVQIPESLVIRSNRIKNGVFEAEFETAPGVRYEIQLKEVSTIADRETQTYGVTFTLPAPKDLNVLPGMTAIVHIKLQSIKGEEKETFIIPISSVFSDKKGTSYVWVIQPSTHTLQKQEVRIGKLVGDGVVVTEGLSPGQNIVAAGAEFVQEGMKVKPFEGSGE